MRFLRFLLTWNSTANVFPIADFSVLRSRVPFFDEWAVSNNNIVCHIDRQRQTSKGGHLEAVRL